MTQDPCDVRSLAVTVLEKVWLGGKVQAEVDLILKKYPLGSKDRHLLAELSYGVLRTYLRLEFICQRFLPDLDKLPLKCRLILYLAIYSLLYLERIPLHAVIYSAVKLGKIFFNERLAALINATLRNISSNLADFLDFQAYSLPSDPKEQAPILSLARYYSLPTWLANYWAECYGLAAAIKLIIRASLRPPVSILINQTHPKAHDLQAALKMFHMKHFLALDPLAPYSFSTTPKAWQEIAKTLDLVNAHQIGVYSFLSQGSQQILKHLGLASWDRPIWDVCAGFGGKSAALAESGCAIAICSDTSKKRLYGLKADFARRNLPMPLIMAADGLTPPINNFSGHILIDAPCSGLGVLARRPDLRLTHKSKRSLRLFPAKQLALLNRAAQFLTSGAELAYITCTLNPKENEQVVESFLRNYPNIHILSQWQTPHTSSYAEGMYGVLLRKS